MAVDPTPFYHDVAITRPRFGLIGFQDIRPTADPPYLVKGLVPREGLTVVWGPPKSGKSFWTFDLGMAVALGQDYQTRRVQAGAVVYVACEGATGLRGRVEAYRRHHGIDQQEPVPFYLVPDALDLTTDAAALIASIRQTLGESRPSLVVLDTLNRSLSGSENDPADMGAYIKAADTIRETFTCAVVIVHHCGTEGSRPRGHTSLTGAADAQLAVKRTADSTITTTVEWMKDGPEGDQIVSRLEPVEVGTDDEGEPITSCVIVPMEGPSQAERKPLTGYPKTAYTALIAVVDNLPASDDEGPSSCESLATSRTSRPCPVSNWRTEFTARCIDAPDIKPDTLLKRFTRAAEELERRGIVGFRGKMAWVIWTNRT